MEIIEGKVLAGQKLGRQFGFPTVNIHYDGKEKGVFAGKVFLNGEWRIAAINVGGRPTVDAVTDLCEAFLLDWHEGIPVGMGIKIQLDKKIREIQKFANFEELKSQIAKDVEFVKNCYNL